MTDVALIPIDPGADTVGFDLGITAGDLTHEEGLITAVIISLYTDRRAEDDDTLPAAGEDRRGWWGDAYATPAGARIGSRLWLLSRAKQTADTLNQVRDYAQEALAWLVEDGVAQRVDVEADAPVTGALRLSIAIHRPTAPTIKYRFDDFWGTYGL